MVGEETKSMRLDPRTELLLLVIANIVAFTYSVPWIEFAVIGVLALLLICCGCGKTGTALNCRTARSFFIRWMKTALTRFAAA